MAKFNHHTPININNWIILLCMWLDNYLLIINTSPCCTQIIRKKGKRTMETGGKACLFMKAQGLRIDRKHVCLRRGHVVSLGLQYAKMSSTDPKRLNYYHLNSKNTLQITLNSKLGCGYSAGQWNTAFLHSLWGFFLYLEVEKHGICHDDFFFLVLQSGNLDSTKPHGCPS